MVVSLMLLADGVSKTTTGFDGNFSMVHFHNISVKLNIPIYPT